MASKLPVPPPSSPDAFKVKKAAVRELPYPAVGIAKLKDPRKKSVDFDGNFLKFHEGFYKMGKSKSKCLINKWSTENRIDFLGFSLVKNIRHHSIVTLENYFDESGQPRIVISWVDGSLTAWLRQGGYKRCFETATEVQGNCPSRVFRRIIIDTCKALQHLISQEVYPVGIKESDLFLCNEKEKGEGSSLKLLVCQAERLLSSTDKKNRSAKLWGDLKTLFQEICKHSDKMLTAAAKSFVNYIKEGNVEKLEQFPDIWALEKKASYLLLLVAADRSEVRSKLNKIQFSWPAINQLLQALLNYELNKQRPTKYDMNDGYDYLRLCRNVIKHWKQFRANVKLLRVSCSSVRAFLLKLEVWTPGVWCTLYKEIGWPEAN